MWQKFLLHKTNMCFWVYFQFCHLIFISEPKRVSHTPQLQAPKLEHRFPKAFYVVSKERNVIPEDATPDTCEVPAFSLFSVSITFQYLGSLYLFY